MSLEDRAEFEDKLVKAGKVAVEYLERMIGDPDISDDNQITAAKAILDKVVKENSNNGGTKVLINFNVDHLKEGIGKIRSITENPRVLPDNTP